MSYWEIDGNIDSNFQSANVDVSAFFDGILAQFGDFLNKLVTAIGGLLDFTPPLLETSGNQTVERVLPGGAPVPFDAGSRDVDIFGNSVDIFGNVIGDPSPYVQCMDQNGAVRHSGDLFAQGAWTVTCHAWDHKYDILQDAYVLGNESLPKSFTITVTPDATPPVLDVPDDLVVEATSDLTQVTYEATASDSVDGAVTPICVPASGSSFGITTTTVNCTATDQEGNQASASFHVTVQDTTPPVLKLLGGAPPPAEATGPSGAVVGYLPVAVDSIDGTVIPSCDHPPDSLVPFPLGDTTVTCTATDIRGNQSSLQFNVSVVDTTAPSISIALPAQFEANTIGGANLDILSAAQITTSDIVDTHVDVTCSLSPGVAFYQATTLEGAVGHGFSCNATDDSGNTATASAGFEVIDTTPPAVALTAPADGMQVPQGDPLVAAYACTDIADAAPDCVGSVASGDLADTSALGPHTFSVAATDNSGNVTMVSHAYEVVPDPVKDETDPVSGGTIEVSVDEPGVSVAAITGSVLPVPPPDGIQMPYGLVGFRLDGVTPGGSVDVTVQFPTDAGSLPGRYFKLSADGTSLVDASSIATIDDTANSVLLHLVDNGPFDYDPTLGVIVDPGTFGLDEPPTLTVPADITVLADPAVGGAVVEYTVLAYDGYDGVLTPVCDVASGATFAPGKTTVTCFVTDTDGDTVTGSFSVQVDYAFAGFFSPVDNDAVNRIVAGRSVPIKFTLGGDFGLAVIAPSSPVWYSVNCDGGVPESDVEDTDTAGQSVLQYDPDTGTYTYVWKTPTTWAKGTCVTFEMTLTDGSTHTAEFKVK